MEFLNLVIVRTDLTSLKWFFFSKKVNYDVVEVKKDKFAEQRIEILFHERHWGGRGFHHAKFEDLIFKTALLGAKRGARNFILFKFNLVVPRFQIDLRQEIGAGNIFKELTN